jgi:hypothetical protein
MFASVKAWPAARYSLSEEICYPSPRGEEGRPRLGEIAAVEDGHDLAGRNAISIGSLDARDEAGDPRGHVGRAVKVERHFAHETHFDRDMRRPRRLRGDPQRLSLGHGEVDDLRHLVVAAAAVLVSMATVFLLGGHGHYRPQRQRRQDTAKEMVSSCHRSGHSFLVVAATPMASSTINCFMKAPSPGP